MNTMQVMAFRSKNLLDKLKNGLIIEKTDKGEIEMNYKIKTHKNDGQHAVDDSGCEFCGAPAVYWSEAEYSDGYRAGSGGVNHCQRHRAWAREQAEREVPTIKRLV